MMGAAEAKSNERKYIDKISGENHLDDQVLEALGTPDLSLESPAMEAMRIQDANARMAGKVSDLRISEGELRSRGVEVGVNPNPTRENEVTGTAREHFAKGPDDPLIESEAQIAARLKNPGQTERMASLKRDAMSRQADISKLRQQIAQQGDPTLRAAQEKVLGQFERELASVQKELDELSR